MTVRYSKQPQLLIAIGVLLIAIGLQLTNLLPDNVQYLQGLFFGLGLLLEGAGMGLLLKERREQKLNNNN